MANKKQRIPSAILDVPSLPLLALNSTTTESIMVHLILWPERKFFQPQILQGKVTIEAFNS
jgi:hypothetical protein